MSTRLGIDVGNTHIKIGVLDGDRVVDVWRFRTDTERSVDEYYFQLQNVCREAKLETIPELLIASVVPSVTIAFQLLEETRGVKSTFIDVKSPLSYGFHPAINHQVGADILILAEAAVRLKGKDVIIVSAGTATTVFAISDGVFQGGAISPGIKGSVESLIAKAALLKTVYLDVPDSPIGQNTDDAVRSGVIFGYAGMIDGLVMRMREELGKPDMPVLASGGMIAKFAKVSRTIHEIKPDLGIQGLAYLSGKL